MKWSDMDKIQKISLVEKMAAEGLSASQIARQFDGATRSAVIGFADRNKICLMGKRWPEKGKELTPANDEAKTAPTATKASPKPPKAVKAKSDEPRKPAKVTRIVRPARKTKKVDETFEALEFKPPAPPEPRPLNLLELNESHCKWPCSSMRKRSRSESACSAAAMFGTDDRIVSNIVGWPTTASSVRERLVKARVVSRGSAGRFGGGGR